MTETSAFNSVSFDLKAFIEKHQTFKKKINYSFNEISALLNKAKLRFQRESPLCEVDIPINIVGDIHGQYSDLQRIFAAVGSPQKVRYLFLGDYVDRGPQSLECICSLIAYKLAFPNQIFLLRGNHECKFVNRGYGFWDEIHSRFKCDVAGQLFHKFNDLFNYFPLAALVKNRILCMHGGLSPHLNSLDDIKNIQMPAINVTSDGLAQDLLWSDPKYDLKGFQYNDTRECSVFFGEDVVIKTCKKLNLDLIVRAHQVMKNGYAFFADRHLVTIFSAPRYVSEINNKGAVMHINASMVVNFVILNPATINEQGANAFKNAFLQECSSEYSSLE